MAASSVAQIDSAIYTGMLWGIMQTLVDTTTPVKFKLDEFMTALNTACCGSLKGLFALNVIVLDPLANQITYLSMGMPDLIHLPEGGTTIRKLSSQNDPLGANPNQTFSTTTDNWNEGDTLISHSLISDDESFPLVLEDALVDNSLLSAQPQAEAILKRLSPSSHSLRYPKALIVIQRIT
jgi:serine phosphatase RsbU (regulator of sigma subunit)